MFRNQDWMVSSFLKVIGNGLDKRWIASISGPPSAKYWITPISLPPAVEGKMSFIKGDLTLRVPILDQFNGEAPHPRLVNGSTMIGW